MTARRSAQLGLFGALVLLVGSVSILAQASARKHGSLGDRAEFSLPDTEARMYASAQYRGRVAVLLFTNVRCPTSNDYTARFAGLGVRYAREPRVQVLAIETGQSSSHLTWLDELRVRRAVAGQPFPTLIDRGSAVARQLDVRVTPTAVVLDEQGVVRYRGAFDNHPDEARVTRPYCEEAVERLLAGLPLTQPTTQAFGCAISQPK